MGGISRMLGAGRDEEGHNAFRWRVSSCGDQGKRGPQSTVPGEGGNGRSVCLQPLEGPEEGKPMGARHRLGARGEMCVWLDAAA